MEVIINDNKWEKEADLFLINGVRVIDFCMSWQLPFPSPEERNTLWPVCPVFISRDAFSM